MLATIAAAARRQTTAVKYAQKGGAGIQGGPAPGPAPNDACSKYKMPNAAIAAAKNIRPSSMSFPIRFIGLRVSGLVNRLVSFSSPLFENHEHRGDHQDKPQDVIPLDRLVQIEDREDGEHGEGDHFLNRFELHRGEFVRPNAVCRDLKAIFEECDAPANEDHFEQRRLPELQVSVPGESHEDI